MAMKRLTICALLVIGLRFFLGANEIELTVSVDWQMSVQAGVEYRFSDHAGIKGDIGVSVLGLLSADLYGVYYLNEADSPWQFMALVGIPNAGTPLSFAGAMVSVGGAVEIKRSLGDRFSIGVVAGAGFPFFFEADTDVIRDINFPFDLWPELVVCFGMAPRGN